ncbi:hypothetical protein JYU34_011148 [Plutella xylostella]|uniref:Uncharacterized protein n=1 Tax=Plutella xylostella TaxID=51655 RepID=A0ABQ7QG76_PLUXY|nr:hypothetical protein JYU34_011148 [Plutella xylostella]
MLDSLCVQRLEKQLTKDVVALSGKGFFYLNRGILLEVVSSIIKYELVLLEFDKK